MLATTAAIFISATIAQNTFKDDWQVIDDHELYSFEVPEFMEASDELNSEASHQFEYVELIGKKTYEMYVIVLFETHEEIASYDLDEDFSASTYFDLAADNLTASLEKVQIVNRTPMKDFNDMRLVKADIHARFGKVKIVYHLAVYEGQTAFYQVLTWTIADQFEYFKDDMYHIIESFKEK